MKQVRQDAGPDKHYCFRCGYRLLLIHMCKGGAHPHLIKESDIENITCIKCDHYCSKLNIKRNNMFTYDAKGFGAFSSKARALEWSKVHFGCYISDEEFNIKEIIE